MTCNFFFFTFFFSLFILISFLLSQIAYSFIWMCYVLSSMHYLHICTLHSLAKAYRSNTHSIYSLFMYTRHILMARDFFLFPWRREQSECCWMERGTYNFTLGGKKERFVDVVSVCQLLLSLSPSFFTIFVCSWFVKTNRNYLSHRLVSKTCNAFVLPHFATASAAAAAAEAHVCART